MSNHTFKPVKVKTKNGKSSPSMSNVEKLLSNSWQFTKDNWTKQSFLLFWSLFSGFGIIFAVESFFYELFQIEGGHQNTGIKGAIALFVGFAIGSIHFQLTVDDGGPKMHPAVVRGLKRHKV